MLRVLKLWRIAQGGDQVRTWSGNYSPPDMLVTRLHQTLHSPELHILSSSRHPPSPPCEWADQPGWVMPTWQKEMSYEISDLIYVSGGLELTVTFLLVSQRSGPDNSQNSENYEILSKSPPQLQYSAEYLEVRCQGLIPVVAFLFI